MKYFLLFSLFRKIKIKPINREITIPKEIFIGMIYPNVMLLLTLVKLTVIKEKIETKIPIIVRILA